MDHRCDPKFVIRISTGNSDSYLYQHIGNRICLWGIVGQAGVYNYQLNHVPVDGTVTDPDHMRITSYIHVIWQLRKFRFDFCYNLLGVNFSNYVTDQQC